MNAQRAPKELRIALALKGGVSLAVWIGGVVAELELMRSCFDQVPEGSDTHSERRRRYRDLLESQGYTSVVVDVLAGASAGGLNAVLYGFAQAASVNLDWAREVWESEGDIDALFRPTSWRTLFAEVPSILQGDGFFYPRLRRAMLLRGTSAAGFDVEPRESAHLSIDLSATAIGYTPRGGGSPRLSSQRVDGAAHLHFDRRPAPIVAEGPAPSQGRPMFNDIPSRADFDSNLVAASSAIARMAYAGRTTSSFPGAFEPARIASRSVFHSDEPEAPQPAMDSLFSGVDDDQDFLVVDGGVLDNIPIERAVEAIGDSSAYFMSDRWLLYVEPTPSAPSEEVTPERSKAQGVGLLKNALMALAIKSRSETVEEDLLSVREKLSQLHRQLPKTTVLAGLLAPPAPPLDADDPQIRARVAAENLAPLLADPHVQMLRYPGCRRALPSMSTRALIPLGDMLRARYRDAVVPREGDPLAGDLEALSFASAALILALQQRQADVASGQGGLDTAELGILSSSKSTAYRVRAVVGALRLEAHRALLLRFWDGMNDVVPGVPLDRSLRGEDLNPIYLPSGGPGIEFPAFGPLVGAISGITAGPEASSQNADSITEISFWGAMTSYFRQLQDATMAGVTDAENPVDPNLVAKLWGVLGELYTDSLLQDLGLAPGTGPAQGSPDESVATLKNAVRALMVSGLIDSTLGTFSYGEITGDEPTALVFDEIEAVGAAGYVARMVKSDYSPPDGDWGAARRSLSAAARMSGTAKLRGSQFGNFGGFLKREWRTQDWVWGRLDASASVVRLFSGLSEDDAQAEKVALAQDILEESEGGEPAGTVAARLGRPNPGLIDLSATSRHRIAYRITDLSLRALRPIGWSFPNAAIWLLLAVLRPFVNWLTLAVRPVAFLILGVALAVYGFAVTAPSEATPNGSLRTAYLLAVAVVAAISAIRLMILARAWRRLDGLSGNTRSTAGQGSGATAAVGRTLEGVKSRWTFCIGLGVATLALVVAAVALARTAGNGDPLLWPGDPLAEHWPGLPIAVVCIAGFIVLCLAVKAALEDPRGKAPLRAVALLLAAVAIAAGPLLAAAVQLHAQGLFDLGEHGWIVPGALVAVAAGLLFWSWAPRALSLPAAVLSGGLTAVGVAFWPESWPGLGPFGWTLIGLLVITPLIGAVLPSAKIESSAT